jgi:hypothetical protein
VERQSQFQQPQLHIQYGLLFLPPLPPREARAMASAAQADGVRPAAAISIGADWRPRRTWALGVQLDNLWRFGGPGGTTPALGVSVRFSNIFEPGGL